MIELVSIVSGALCGAGVIAVRRAVPGRRGTLVTLVAGAALLALMYLWAMRARAAYPATFGPFVGIIALWGGVRANPQISRHPGRRPE